MYMSRTERLFELIQILRRHRRPVSGQVLADELGISIRTLYRDIATLQGQGAEIEGEPGLGYVLRPGFMLPPLMFSEDEIEAIVLGSQWVMDRADGRLAEAAQNAIAKIGAVLPRDLRDQLDSNGLLVAPGRPIITGTLDLGIIRQAIRRERKAEIAYTSLEGVESERTIWPFALGFFDQVRIVSAFCELRNDIRHFRADRITRLDVLETRYPKRRQALMKDWREQLAEERRRKVAGEESYTVTN